MSQGPHEELPASIVAWIEGLAFGKKRNYAEAYAWSILRGSEPPASPAFSRKDWPTRARKRVERLLRESYVSTSAEVPANLLDDDDYDDDFDPGLHDPIAIDISDPALAGSTVNQLVPGLSGIGDLAIPYDQLPRRAATRYAHEFKTWSQVGDVTIDMLMSRRGAGVETVNAMFQAAVDAVRFPGNRLVSHTSDDEEPGVNFDTLRSGLVLVGSWWSLFHDRPANLQELLKLDRSEIPADVSAALATIADFTSPHHSAPITASAAVQVLLDKVDDRERGVLIARIWSETPSTLEAIAGNIGVTRERVRQIQSKAEARVRALFAQAQDRPVAWYANELERRLGPYVPRQLAEETLRALGVDVPSLPAQVLLHFAGPYAMRSDGWLEKVGSSGAAIVTAAVDQVINSGTEPNTACLVDALGELGMEPELAMLYLNTQASLKQFGDIWVRWRGTAVDKAHTILDLSGEPLTADAINESIGEGHSVMTLKNGMSSDSRFVRTGRRTWGLRAWGVEEYSGIVEEILERIDAAGGTVGTEELITELVSTFPDVAENSIKIYLGTLAFVVEGGTVRRRTDSDAWPEVGQFKDARGSFRRGASEVRLAINVTRDVLRGSGFAIHAAVATALGTPPGSRRVFTSTEGAVAAIGWRPWSTTGPDIGSVRAFATATAAQPGDTLVLVFNTENNSVEAVKVPVEASGDVRLAGLFGVDSTEDLEAALAAGLECRASEVRSVLRCRGEGDIAELIPVAADARLDNEIASLIAELT